MEYILIIISAVFVNNILLAQFLGVCPFLGVSNKVSTAVGMSGAVCFVMAVHFASRDALLDKHLRTFGKGQANGLIELLGLRDARHTERRTAGIGFDEERKAQLLDNGRCIVALSATQKDLTCQIDLAFERAFGGHLVEGNHGRGHRA